MVIIDLIIFLFWVLTLWISYKGNQILWKRASDFFEKSNPSAEVRNQCLLREAFYFSQLGVAQIADGKLDFYGVLGNILNVPVNQIKVKKIRKNCFMRTCGFRRFTVFFLDFPSKPNLKLGIESKDSMPWENILKLTESYNLCTSNNL